MQSPRTRATRQKTAPAYFNRSDARAQKTEAVISTDPMLKNKMQKLDRLIVSNKR
jgi:hypothetical protein